ncbi:hypothetical protein PENANT_c039G00342 [Penicillium antarcticum]|uniref:Uncharacterized protein n=1 Tax=Penicillium antarcticum TaxID=416450 RepID=A0A1V6PSY0_9EURO|nr:hypothetical protein PENANT_c039G00342 [Penicillium antarcticum]
MYSSGSFRKAAVGFLLGAALVQGAYIPSIDRRNNTSALNARAGNEYRIAVYQNAQCTGEAIPYFGDNEDCHTASPDCNGNPVAAFNPNKDQTGTDCKPLPGNPVSFRFENA